MKFPEIPDYGIIDAHMHPYLAHHRNFPFGVPVTYDQFFAEQRRAGITLSCGAFNIINDGTDFSVIEKCNAQVLEVYRAHPDEFMPGVNIHPHFPEQSCQQIQKFHDLGFRWIGEIAWYIMGYKSYSTPGMHQILETAQDLGMVLSIHPSTIEDVSDLAGKFPRLPIVVAHPESNGIMANYQMAQKHSNIYLDLSGGGLFRWGMLRKGIDILGADRILFGTDFPIVSSGMNVAGVLFEHITAVELRMVLRENFLRLIGDGCVREKKCVSTKKTNNA